MTDEHDVIAAFVDNEPVGAPDLRCALEQPAGRDYLIDLLVLRGLVGDAHGAGVLQPAGRTMGATRAAGDARSTRQGMWLTAAAAVVAIAVAAGFAAGRLTVGGAAGDSRVASNVESPGPTTMAPAPTHVIRMEDGVVWNERAGGN
jgi:hypothetical protein